jgi:hypothetical protein
MWTARVISLFIGVLVFTSCVPGPLPKRMSVHDPELAPFKEAMAQVDTAALGFEPFPTTGELRLELASRPGGAYDAMLHVHRSTIAFRKTPAGYQWIMQQEVHYGPRLQEHPDGPMAESVVIDHVTTPGYSAPPNQTVIRYWGDDPRLMHEPLTIEQVRPILEEWDRGQAQR